MMRDKEDRSLAIGALPIRDASAACTERIAAECHRVLARRAPSPTLRRSVRRAEIVAIAVLGVSYLAWAVDRALVLLGAVAGR